MLLEATISLQKAGIETLEQLAISLALFEEIKVKLSLLAFKQIHLLIDNVFEHLPVTKFGAKGWE